jgi:hypothetical protein
MSGDLIFVPSPAISASPMPGIFLALGPFHFLKPHKATINFIRHATLNTRRILHARMDDASLD